MSIEIKLIPSNFVLQHYLCNFLLWIVNTPLIYNNPSRFSRWSLLIATCVWFNTVNFAKYFRNASFSCGANALLVNCIFMLGNKLIPWSHKNLARALQIPRVLRAPANHGCPEQLLRQPGLGLAATSANGGGAKRWERARLAALVHLGPGIIMDVN